MRLRQIAFASRRLDQLVGEFHKVLGLEVAYVDPNVGRYGLRNAVMPCGDSFLEVCEPFTETASISRFLDRRGGDAGYMIILQVADAAAERERVAADGVRVVEIIDRPHYLCAHFHPADFGGVLASFDQQRTLSDHLSPHSDWWPAGPDWRKAQTHDVVEMTSVTIAAADPDALAKRWSKLLARPLDAGDGRRIALEKGAICFSAARAGGGTSIAAIDLKMRDPAQAISRAKTAGLDVSGDGVLIGGVRFRLTA